MGAMTNVAVPVADGASANWTLIYTAGATVTCNVHNRGNQDLLVRLNGSTGAVGDALDAAAELVAPGSTIALVLANGDKVLARPYFPADSGLANAGRVTIRV